jgi:hypothetical protein
VDVRNRAEFQKVLETQHERRGEYGERAFSYSVDDDQRHIGYVTLEWESFRSLRQFLASPASRALMQEWPVVEVFEILALRGLDEFDA